jgi:hypothetical protein
VLEPRLIDLLAQGQRWMDSLRHSLDKAAVEGKAVYD